MCFSATANFAGSAVVGTIGVATLAQVRHRRAFMFAAMPLLFAVRHFIEGLVWLGLDGILPAYVAQDAGAALCSMRRDCCRSCCLERISD